MQRIAAVRLAVGVLVGLVGACAQRPALPTCGSGWAPLAEDRGDRIAWAAPDPTTTIEDVAVTGVDPALRSTLAAVITTRRGQHVGDAPLGSDLRALWGLGVVADARVELAGSVVTFAITPRLRIDRVVFAGALLPRFALLRGAPFEPARLRRIAEGAQRSYLREGHLDAQIRVEQARTSGGVALCIAARPGPRVTISTVRFPGRHRLPDAVLRAAIHGDEGGVNHVGGPYDADALAVDRAFLAAKYYDVGSLDVTIGAPRVVRHGPQLELAIPIAEGPVYRVRSVTSPVPLPRGVRRGDVFSRTKVKAMRDHLARSLRTAVSTATHLDRDAHVVDLELVVDWRWPWDAWRPWLAHSR